MEAYKVIEVKQSIFEDNDADAARLRSELKEKKTVLLKIIILFFYHQQSFFNTVGNREVAHEFSKFNYFLY